jgi:serine O-acetyltransferase
VGDRHPKIQENVLIGASATILGNITIGRGAQIAAGSLVLKPVEPHTMVAGSPARPVGRVVGNPALRMQHWSKKLAVHDPFCDDAQQEQQEQQQQQQTKMPDMLDTVDEEGQDGVDASAEGPSPSSGLPGSNGAAPAVPAAAESAQSTLRTRAASSTTGSGSAAGAPAAAAPPSSAEQAGSSSDGPVAAPASSGPRPLQDAVLGSKIGWSGPVVPWPRQGDEGDGVEYFI